MMNTSSHREYVEQFHLLFLEQLGRKLDKSLYAVKGGCNLRFFLKSVRYSEDLDIDVVTVAVDTLRNKIDRILSSQPFESMLQAKGLRLSDVTLPKQTQTTQRWKLRLNVPNTDLPINTKIEFSRRNETLANIKFEAAEPSIIGQYKLSPILATHYTAEAALEQKIHALSNRTQTQARDVFDINHLLNCGTVLSSSFDSTRMNISDLQKNALSLSFNDFKGQVLAYLPQDIVTLYDSEDAWKAMVLKVIELVEGAEHETH